MNTSHQALPDTPCYLNGEFIPLKDAKISVMDRGFIFGDGIYEVVPVYGSHPFRFEHHMARLTRSLQELRIPNPFDMAGWQLLLGQLLADHAAHCGKNPQTFNQIVYIQITRGVAPRDHVMPKNLTPSVFVMVNEMKQLGDVERTQGVDCVSAADFRWEKAHIKSTSLLGSVLSRQISADVGAMETVMFRGDFLSEAAASNVWVVKNGVVLGPVKNNLVLEGIRYSLIDEICRAQGIPFELRPITRAEVLNADELLLSSATKEILPIRSLDGVDVGQANHKGRPGPVYAKLYAGYQLAKQAAAK